MSSVETDIQSTHEAVEPIRDFIPALDGLRGIAILWVILHNGLAFDFGESRIKAMSIFANAGWVGVQLFFVLSGFLITRNLLRARSSPNYFRSFYIKRALRILPLCYAFLLVMLIIVPLFWPHTEAGEPFQPGHIWAWTFLYNWSVPLGWPSYGVPHFWSLAVEEQFYLLWPFVVHRWCGNALLKVCGIIIAIAFISRVVLIYVGANADMVYEFTSSRMDALAGGAAIAALLQHRETRVQIQRNAHKLLPMSGAILLVTALISNAFARDDTSTQTVGQTLLAISFGLILVDAIIADRIRNAWTDSVLRSRALVTVGRYSFGMYVLHFPIAQMLTTTGVELERAIGPSYVIVWYAMVVAATFIAARFSYYALELPFLEMKKRFAPA